MQKIQKQPRKYKLPENWRDRPDAPPPGVELPPEVMEQIEAQYLALNSPPASSAPTQDLPPLAPDAPPRDYIPTPQPPATPPLADVIQQSCQNSFLAFCCLVMPDFLPTKVHTYLANQLQQVYEDVKAGRDPRVMVEIQPQIGKSTLTSVLFPAWVLGKESWPIICASYGSGLAERNSYMCREIIDSAAYRIVFPTVKLRSDSTSKEFWRTTTDGSYKAIGVGGGLTGFSGRLILVDDPIKDRADADSETIRESTWRWFGTVLYTRKQQSSAVVVVNTRWHLDDVSGRLLQQQEDSEAAGMDKNHYDRWKRLRFPAIAEEDEYIDGKLFRKQGEAICPERFDVDTLMRMRNSLDVYDWSSLYQQSPILTENAEFKQEYFRYFEEKDIEHKSLLVYVLVDLAISEKKSADNTSAQVFGKERTSPEIYKLEDKTGRFDPGDLIEYLFHIKNKYGNRLVRVGLETVGYQKAMKYMLMEEMKKRGVYFDILELKSSSAKADRIRGGLLPMYKSGVIYHRKGIDNDYERELLQFPKGKHDDRIDAAAYLPQVLDQTKSSLSAKQFKPKLKQWGL